MRVIRGIGISFLTILKITLWTITKVFYLVLELIKILLLLFGLVMRIFLSIIRAATP